MSFALASNTPQPSPARTRVMIVDDSVVVRGLVSRWIAEVDGFEVVATASNGKIALDTVDRAEPDILLLDIEMPEMDGLAALPRLLAKRPGLQVVVLSSLTQRNADISLKCLSLGATDYLPKPESHREVTTSTGFRGELVAKLQALSQSRRRRREVREAPDLRAKLDAPARPPLRPRASMVIPRVLLIGASTGGPRAVGEVLSAMGPALSRIPVLIVQHMPPIFTAVFAEHLQAQTGVLAREPKAGEPLAPGRIFVAPGGRHMGLVKEGVNIVVRLDDGPPVNFCRPAVDVLFRDAAALFGASALAVVLTGMGSDGTNGARALVETGAMVLAQDEATSTVWGMPGSIAKAGLAHDILPLDAIAPALKTIITGTSR